MTTAETETEDWPDHEVTFITAADNRYTITLEGPVLQSVDAKAEEAGIELDDVHDVIAFIIAEYADNHAPIPVKTKNTGEGRFLMPSAVESYYVTRWSS